jgi:hypothetical protein
MHGIEGVIMLRKDWQFLISWKQVYTPLFGIKYEDLT